jgi:hypothetical protein
MDIFSTGKAIDLYDAEMKRRIEGLEKTIKEKEQTIKKYKERDLIAVVFLISLFLVMTAVYLITDHDRCI